MSESIPSQVVRPIAASGQPMEQVGDPRREACLREDRERFFEVSLDLRLVEKVSLR